MAAPIQSLLSAGRRRLAPDAARPPHEPCRLPSVRHCCGPPELVTVALRSPGTLRRPIVGTLAHAWGAGALLVSIGISLAGPAQAQVAGSVTLDSDDRFRGHSLSAGKSGVSASLDY